MSYYINGDGTKVALQSGATAPPQSVDGHVYHDGLILPGVMMNTDGKYVKNTVIAAASDYYETYINDLSTSFPPDNLFKNDYIKVREVALTYTLPRKITQRMKLQGLTITAAARNLFYLYKTIPNIDVESALGADSYVENTIYPGQQTFSLGINLSF